MDFVCFFFFLLIIIIITIIIIIRVILVGKNAALVPFFSVFISLHAWLFELLVAVISGFWMSLFGASVAFTN